MPTPTLDDVFRDEIYRTEARAVRSFLRSLRCSAETAEDVTAQTFLTAFTTTQSDGATKISRGWLMTVARRRLIDHVRLQQRQDRLAQRAAIEPSTHVVSGLATDSLVKRTLDSLPDRQQRALHLRYVEGLPVADLAVQLQVTLSAAESLLARGRRGFAAKYQRQSSVISVAPSSR